MEKIEVLKILNLYVVYEVGHTDECIYSHSIGDIADEILKLANSSNDIQPVIDPVCVGCIHEGTTKWVDPCHTCRDGDLKENGR